MVGNGPSRLEFGNGVQQSLRTTHSKHRHHGRATPCRHAGECGCQLLCKVVDGVDAVSVGGLDQHHIGLGRRLWWQHQHVVGTTEIA